MLPIALWIYRMFSIFHGLKPGTMQSEMRCLYFKKITIAGMQYRTTQRYIDSTRE